LFIGVIGKNLEIHMLLHIDKGKVRGEYCYDKL
jgi:hypothetical protein